MSLKEKKFSRKTILSFVLLQVLWVILLAVSILFPLATVVTLIPLIVLTALFHIKNCRANLLIMIVAQVTVAFASRGDIIIILFSLTMVMGTLAMLWGLKYRSYKVGAGLSSLVMVLVALSTLLFYFVIQLIQGEDVRLYQVVGNYVLSAISLENANSVVASTGSQLRLIARFYYAFSQGTPAAIADYYNFNAPAIIMFNDRVMSWAENGTIFYDIMSAAAFMGIFSFLLISLVNWKTSNIKIESNWAFTVITEPVKFKDMRLGKKYFLYFFLPSLVVMSIGWISSLANPMENISTITSATVNIFITIPTGFAAFALLTHSIDRIKLRRIKIPLFITLGGLFLAAMVMPIVMFAISFLGLADSLINVRKLLNYAFAPLSKEELEMRRKEIEKKVEEEKMKRKKDYDVFKKIERKDDPLEIENLENILDTMEEEEDESNIDK